ncbi:PAS domain-containing sensor histidine kinase [Fodinibius halophilus]|uniref:histidine kinase n=1 Tax=Fodinibius halophilus TaxID=1736908 RepID=A0A6M1TBV1_9BACT|nr:histidine kinase dimerization/phosphoacceptor domain -containing protein [Fodinibius halophilus]NGP88404.1 PAS domain S-box protein [Fodinibius halophilus]
MVGLLNSISNNRSRIAIILVFVVLALFMMVGSYYGIKTLSSVRAYIAGEGQWTKAQKEAVSSLLEYSIHKEPSYYKKFQDKLELHQGFEKARKTLMSDNPHLDVAYRGFQQGVGQDKDIDLLIWVTQNFKDLDLLQKAIGIWAKGDTHIEKLEKLGVQLHTAIKKGELGVEKREQIVAEVSSIDRRLTELEGQFSHTMGELASWVRTLIFWTITIVGITLLLIGYLVVNSFFREINNLNDKLSKSESKFKKVLQHSRDVVYQLDIQSGQYKYISPYVEEMLGYSTDVFLKKGRSFVLDHVHPKDIKKMKQEIMDMEKDGHSEYFADETEFRIKTHEGDYIWVNNQRALVTDDCGEPVGVVGSVRDISERKKNEVEIEQSLKEKQTLLEEIHHRVKNNLAVISSLLELQKHESSESLVSVFEDTQSRIRSIAMIHEKLYQNETLSAINIQEYIEDFTGMVSDAFNSQQKNIAITKEVKSFDLDITKAVPLGLILNELLNNAFKHGFKELKEGEIVVSLDETDGIVHFSVADNGNKLPNDFSLQESSSLGMTLVKTLTQQLEGEIDISQNGWTKFGISFQV